MKTINISTENIFSVWDLDEKDIINKTKLILENMLSRLESQSCLAEFEYKSISLDILFCDSIYTQELNKNYRDKDKPADIITFAIFADDDTKFVLDGEINLGEMIIALDKVIEGVNRDVSHSQNKYQELFFLISHGLMHLLGFDHQSEEEYNFVIEEQRKALESINYDKI